MKISDLIAALEALKQQYGDVPVYIYDPDYGWSKLLEKDCCFENGFDNSPDGMKLPDRIEIKT